MSIPSLLSIVPTRQRSTFLPITHDRSRISATASPPPSPAATNPCPARPDAPSVVVFPNKAAAAPLDYLSPQRSLLREAEARLAADLSSPFPPTTAPLLELTSTTVLVPTGSRHGGGTLSESEESTGQFPSSSRYSPSSSATDNLQSSSSSLDSSRIMLDNSRAANVSNEIEKKKKKKKKKKAFLGFIYTMTERLHSCIIAVFGGILVVNKQRSKENTPSAKIFMSGNILGMVISTFVLSPIASSWRDSESIDHHSVEHGLFTWLVLVVSVYYCEQAWFELILAVSPPVWVAWTLQIIPCLMVIGGTWFICIKWPKIVEEINADSVEADAMSEGGN